MRTILADAARAVFAVILYPVLFVLVGIVINRLYGPSVEGNELGDAALLLMVNFFVATGLWVLALRPIVRRLELVR
jgi:hypothetical protein